MRKESFTLLPFVLSALLLTNGFARQQQTPAPPPQQQPQAAPTPPADDDEEVVRITSNLVQVDAVVTDRDGRQVTDLSADDFVVVENGKPRQVTNFAYVRVAQPSEAAPAPARKRDSSAGPPPPPVRLRPEQVRRTVALVVDDLMMSAESVHHTREALKKYVNEQVQPGDMVSLVRTNSGVGALQQFTSDKQALYRAIERLHWVPRYGGLTPLDSPSLEANPNKMTSAKEVDEEHSGPQDVAEYRNEVNTRDVLVVLNTVVHGLREMPGRKAVVLFSDGLMLRNSKGETQPYELMFRRLVDRANRASVVFYTIDSRGLLPLGPTAADGAEFSGAGLRTRPMTEILRGQSGFLYESQGGLHVLARATGGKALVNDNDLNKGVRRALDDMSGYYLIGYRPDDAAFDPATGRVRFNSLEVKLKRPRGLSVRSRSGYVGQQDAAPGAGQRSRGEQLLAALVSPFGAGGVGVRMTSLFIDEPGGGSALRSLLLIDPRTLTFVRQPDGRQQAKIDVVAATFGDEGAVVDKLDGVETLSVAPESFERVLRDGLVYNITVPVKKPGSYQLRVAVRDAATERVGSASQFVEVPDLKRARLALSGLVVASPAEAGGAADARPADPASRRFRRGGLLDYGFVIYNARLDKVTGRPRLSIQARLFRDGREVYAGQPQPFDPAQAAGLERIEAAGRIQLGAAALTPGEYVLQIVVTDALAEESRRAASQWIDFEIAE